MYLAIALVCAAALALWGYAIGAYRLLCRVAALLLAYALAWQETPALAQWLAARELLPGVMVWPAASLALFVGGGVLFGGLARFIVHVSPEEWLAGWRKSGAVLGSVLGVGVGLLMVWTVSLVQDSLALRQAGDAAGSKVEPGSPPALLANPGMVRSPTDDWVRKLSGEAVGRAAESVLAEGPAATMAGRWLREPVSLSEGMRYFVEKPELRVLFQNPASYAVLAKGSAEEIQRLPDFQALLADARVMNFLGLVGLPGDNPSQQSRALAELLSRNVRNFEKVRSTPEFRALADDPELQQIMQQGNLLALLTHDKLRDLAAMLSAGNLSADLPAATTLQQRAEAMAKGEGLRHAAPGAAAVSAGEESKLLYRWKDERGRVHITEQKPPEGVGFDVIQP